MCSLWSMGFDSLFIISIQLLNLFKGRSWLKFNLLNFNIIIIQIEIYFLFSKIFKVSYFVFTKRDFEYGFFR